MLPTFWRKVSRYARSAPTCKSGKTQVLSLSPEAFLHRFLQHVVPKGFQRVRYFGWLSPAAKSRWERILALLDWKSPALAPHAPPPPPLCPTCNKPMALIGLLARAPPTWKK